MHFIDGIEDGREGIAALALRALELKAGAEPRRAEARRLVAAFLNPSLRTRTSLQAAAGALAGAGVDAFTFVAHPSNAGTTVDPVP